MNPQTDSGHFSGPEPVARHVANETERLAALRHLALTEQAPPDTFSLVTQLMSQTLGVPIALIGLVDESRLLPLARFGTEIGPLARDRSFCAQVIAERRALVVEDALADPRFAGSPLVIGPPQVRAYLGIPLHTLAGQPIATLCAMDTQARRFTEQDVRLAWDYAHIVEESIHARERIAQAESLRQTALERERLFSDTFELAGVGMAHTALNGQLMRANRRLCQMLGYSQDELRALTFLDITHPDDVAKNMTLFRDAAAGRIEGYRFDKRFRCRNGGYLWVDLSVSVRRSAAGAPQFLIAVVEDISDKKQNETELTRMRDSLAAEVALQTGQLLERNETLRVQFKQTIESEHALRQSQQRLSAVANAVPAMIAYFSRALRCEFANEAHREWFGLAPEQVAGMTMTEIVGAEVFRELEPHVQLALAGHFQRFERSASRPDGTVGTLDVRYVPDISDSGEAQGFFILSTDVSALREALHALESAHTRLVQESVMDYLTGLSNRRVFSEHSEAAARRFQATGTPYGLILLDLDDFKQINDDYGHDVGDEVLRAMGRILKEQLRERDDVVARLGGEEFAVLCFGAVSESALCQLATRIGEQIGKEGVHCPKGIVRFTSSFGVALSQAEDLGWRSIYARADAALYEAKASGKNCVVFGYTNFKATTGRLRSLSEQA
jgi:diguanylate cyclase (GGDEF)-like protein/PAS domain S-box-containing protein